MPLFGEITEETALAEVVIDVDTTTISGAAGHDEAPIRSVEVRLEVDRPSSAVIRSADVDEDSFDWIDGGKIQEGFPLTVSMGYSKSTTPVFYGEVTGLELELSPEAAPRTTIRGHDLLHRLLRNYPTVVYSKKKDSDIVSDIAKRNGLSFSGSTTTIQHEYILQNGQSDLEFVAARAKALGFEFLMEEQKLLFRPRNIKASPSIEISRTGEKLDLYVRTSILGQVGAVSVRGWDPTTQKPIEAEAPVAKVTALMGGKKLGAKLADETLGAAIGTASGAITTQAVADQIARSQLEEGLLKYITCEATIVGTPTLRAGMTVELKEIGSRLSGTYYLQRVIHTFEDGEYSTQILGRRSAT